MNPATLTEGGRHRNNGAPAATDRTGGWRTLFTAKSGDGVRHDLEGLRAIAVLGVVVYHLRPSWLPGGFAGVDVFFVLSGFFITGLLLREIDRSGSVSLIKFWGRRARRLLPASALVIVATVVGGYYLTNALEAKRIAQDGFFAAIFGMNWRSAYQQTQYLADPNPSPFVHYWSLGVEEQFYIGWPLLLLALAALWRVARRRSWASPRVSLFVIAVVVGVASFLLALSQTKNDNSYAYFGTFERVWQLALGGLCAVLITQVERVPALVLAVSRYAGVALVVAFYFAASTDILYPGRKALIPAVGAALIVLAGEPRWRRRDPLSWTLCSWPAQLGGRYSYSWYLWHYPPLVLLPIYLDRKLTVGELVLCAVGTLAAAVLTYHLLENPVRQNRWLSSRRGGRSLALGAVLVVLGIGVAQGLAAAATHEANDSGISNASGQLLVPQPGPAAAENPQPYLDGCILGTDNTTSKVPSGTNPDVKGCRYLPNTGHGDVIMVGDSHAAMWFSAIRDMAKTNGWGMTFWARNSCPLADVTKEVGDNAPYTACDGYRKNLIKAIIAAHPSMLITSNLDSAIPALFQRDSSGKPTTHLVGGTPGRLLWEQGMERSLSQLRAAGIKVLVIHDTPGYPRDLTAPDCVLKNPKNLDACSAPQSAAMPGAPNDLSAARSVGNVSTIDFTNIFCRGGRCYQVLGHTLAYRDYNHISQEMTAELLPALTPVAKQTMQGKTVHTVVRAGSVRD